MLKTELSDNHCPNAMNEMPIIKTSDYESSNATEGMLKIEPAL